MSKITREEVEHVAHLARLRIPDNQMEMFTDQMNDILVYMEKLQQIDTKDVEPTSHAVPLPTAWREDVIEPSLDPEKALANAPDREDQFIVVPRVIE
jgi:aspartyl-tRNA(Asn)/glutamyl-tRNA(Gln) amidotransferase subunit C